MPTDDKLSATGTGSVRTLTIQIVNVSDTGVGINYGQLTGGNWDGPGPVPGDSISAGRAGETSFVNGGYSIYTALGGTLQLSPYSGGTITITWSWPAGQAVTGSASGSGLAGLSVTMGVINAQSMNPTQQIFIGNTWSLAQALGVAAGD